MKRLVHITESFGSGVFSFLTELCNPIYSDFEIIIIYSIRRETPRNFKDEFKDGIRFINLDMCRGLSPVKNFISLYKLCKTLKELKPYIVHLHSSKAGFLGRIACFINGFSMERVFYNPHGYSFLQKNENITKRKLFYGLEKLASCLGGTTVACSKGEYTWALKISNRALNINNGINPIRFENTTIKNINSDKIIIGTVGRICYQKNPKLFNKLAASLKEYDFLWIGDGELRSELTGSNIIVTGWLERKEVLKRLQEIDIFILTSLWEGLPISLLEAMFLKKIVIVSKVPGNKDVVKHNVNGFIAENQLEFIDSINYIIKNNYLNNETYKKSVQNYIFENFNNNKMVEEYKKLYK